MSLNELSADVAITAILIAARSNTLIKCGLAMYVGGMKLGLRASIPLIVALLMALLYVLI